MEKRYNNLFSGKEGQISNMFLMTDLFKNNNLKIKSKHGPIYMYFQVFFIFINLFRCSQSFSL